MAGVENEKTKAEEEGRGVVDLKAITLAIVDSMEGGRSGAGTSGGGSAGTSGGEGAGGATGIPDGTLAVIVDGSGRIVDTATFNASTGVFEQTGVDTTVVTETSSSGASEGPVSAGSGASVETGTGTSSSGASEGPVSAGGGASVETGTETPVGPPGEEPVPEFGSPGFLVPPSIFRFHPVSPTRQQSECVTVPFVFLFGGAPVSTPVLVQVQIRGPRFSGGVELDADAAARRSALATTEAAPRVVEALNLQAISPAQAQQLFEEELRDVFKRRWGPSWEVFRCGV